MTDTEPVDVEARIGELAAQLHADATARIAELRAQYGLASPFAIPPTGLIPDVVDGQLIESAWGNAIRDRTVERFDTLAQLNSQWSPAANGSIAVTLDTYTIYVRQAGVWVIYSKPWAAWTPSLTSTGSQPNLGTDGTRGGRYMISGTACHFTGQLVFGTAGGGTAGGSGVYMIQSLPVPLSPAVAGYQICGHGHANLAGTQRFNVQLLRDGVGTGFQVYTPAQWGAAVPVNVTFGDQILFQGRYEI